MKTKICTDIEQSKKLLELGLDPKTADMYYKYVLPNSDKIMHNPEIGSPLEALEWYNEGYTFSGKKALTVEKFCIPAWSLSALLKLMPQFTLNGFCNGKFNCRDERADNYALVDSNPLDAAFDMVVYLIEQGYIKTEKK